MSKPKRAAGWLSGDMAGALAATCPPLSATDVAWAADEIAIDTNPAYVTSHLLRLGPDLLCARRLVEALRALRDLTN